MINSNSGRNSQMSRSQLKPTDSQPSIQELIAEGNVDYASWRKRKAQREERALLTQSGNVSITGIKQQKAKRSFKQQEFSYVDPVDGAYNRNTRNAPMANLHQMKFHEMKVEREPFVKIDKMSKLQQQNLQKTNGNSNGPAQINLQNSSRQQSSQHQNNHQQHNSAQHRSQTKRGGSIDFFRTIDPDTVNSNFEMDKIERKVTQIMQKYCTPIHPAQARYEGMGRYSVIDRATSSLSRMLDGVGGSAGRNNINAMNQTQTAFGAGQINAGDMRMQYNKTDLSTKQSTTRQDGRKKKDILLPLSTSIQVGSQSVRNNSIAQAIANDHQKGNATIVNDKKDIADHDDGMVIAPAATEGPVATRQSMVIRAKLRPLLNEERITKTANFMEENAMMTQERAKRQNKRKELSKRVNSSFVVDPEEVQRKIMRGTGEDNLPSNRYLKIEKMAARKKLKGKKTLNAVDSKEEVIGWTEISEEQDYGNSDFEAMMGFEQNMVRSNTKIASPKKVSIIDQGFDGTDEDGMVQLGEENGAEIHSMVNAGKGQNNNRSKRKVKSKNSRVVLGIEEDEEDMEELINPELIGASYALKQGNLEKYAEIMTGGIVDVQQLIQERDDDRPMSEQEGEEASENSDAELDEELGKFDDAAYKDHPETLAERLTLDRMVKFDKTFKMVMDHVRKQLDISLLDLNKHIEQTILGSRSEPSPMLKYYNEILQNTNFCLPDRKQLDFDQQVFRKTIDKIVKAHKKELDWVRNVSVYEAKAHLEKKFKETSLILQDETSNLLQQFDLVKSELEIAKTNEKFLHDKLFQSEGRLTQMRLHIGEFRQFIQDQEQQLTIPIQPKLRKANVGMSDEVPSELQKVVPINNANILKSKTRSRSMIQQQAQTTAALVDESKWPKPHLRLVHPNVEREKPGSRIMQAFENNQKFEREFGKQFMPKGNNGLYRDPGLVNPYLKLHSLDFYGAHVSLNIEDRARVLESELIKDYQMRLQEAKEEKEASSFEHQILSKFFHEIKELSDSRQEQIVELRQQLTALEKQIAGERQDWKEKYEMDIDAIETTYSNKLRDCKQIFSCEVEVLSQICQIQQADVIKNRVQMKQIATLLRIPRAHHAYISKYGSYDFIEKCEDIVGNNDAQRYRVQQMEDRAKERQVQSWQRSTKTLRGQSVPVEIPMPKFYRDKSLEREKIKELIQERKDKALRLELQQKQEFKGIIDPNVNIDDTNIDLTDTMDNVQAHIDRAMNIKTFKADFKLTEQKIDEIRQSNINSNEINQSIFTSTLESFINNVGLQLPYDSDPGFYKDHYDREVKARMNLGADDNFYVSEKVSATANGEERSSGTMSSMVHSIQPVEITKPNKTLLHEPSGFTTQMTTQVDEQNSARQLKKPNIEAAAQSQDLKPMLNFWQKRPHPQQSTVSGDIEDIRTSVESINKSQMFNFTMRNINKKSNVDTTAKKSPQQEQQLSERQYQSKIEQQKPDSIKGYNFDLNWQLQKTSGKNFNQESSNKVPQNTLYATTQSSLKSTSQQRIFEVQMNEQNEEVLQGNQTAYGSDEHDKPEIKDTKRYKNEHMSETIECITKTLQYANSTGMSIRNTNI